LYIYVSIRLFNVFNELDSNYISASYIIKSDYLISNPILYIVIIDA